MRRKFWVFQQNDAKTNDFDEGVVQFEMTGHDVQNLLSNVSNLQQYYKVASWKKLTHFLLARREDALRKHFRKQKKI